MIVFFLKTFDFAQKGDSFWNRQLCSTSHVRLRYFKLEFVELEEAMLARGVGFIFPLVTRETLQHTRATPQRV